MVLNMGVEGAEIATLISQLAVAPLVIRQLFKSKNGFFPGLLATATITSENKLAARRTMSSCPMVIGSKVPG